MFRPHHVSIADAGQESRPDIVSFEGRVRHREFLGNLFRYAIDCGGQDILVDDGHQVGRRSYEIDDAVSVTLDPVQVRILSN
jgi:iron(III) transport system ATP-binding protein